MHHSTQQHVVQNTSSLQHLHHHTLPPSIDTTQSTLVNTTNQQQTISQIAQNQIIEDFWNDKMHRMQVHEPDFKNHSLPIARIKKVMKTDDEVKNLASPPPLFSLHSSPLDFITLIV